jgi:hypothetical protein
VWGAHRGPSVNFERYLRREVLGRTPGAVVWGMDEVDRLFHHDFGSEVFRLFRSWHNERTLDPAGPWSRLTLAIAYATEAQLFITDLNQSPFNVGLRLALEDFTPEQVASLNLRHGSPLRSRQDLAAFARLVGGNPYMVRRGLHEMASRRLDLAAFQTCADRDDGLFGDLLRGVRAGISRDPAMRDAVRTILQGRPCPSSEVFFRLRSAGVLTGETAREARLRCQLYHRYLARHLP